MTCARFERWLDDGMPETGDPGARDHAATCPECGRRLAAALELDDILGAPAAPLSDTFTDRLMARIEALPRQRTAANVLVLLPDPFPWWLQVVAEPAVALALLLAVLLGWRLPAFTGASAAALNWLSDRVATAWSGMPPLAAALSHPAVALAVALALTPVMAWISLLCYRGSRNLAERFSLP